MKFGADNRSGPWLERITDRVALGGLVAFTAAAVFGFGLFGIGARPIPEGEVARWIYRNAFIGFARGHVLLTGLVLAAVLVRRVGARWLPALAAVYAASFLSEHLGTGFGLPFGEYGYTGLLGPRLLGRVPLLIPLSWFVMALPSYALATRAGFGPWGRIAAGAWLLAAWDLALDPAMSHLTPYWRWAEEGVYYGMPAINLAGWLLTGSVIMGILQLLAADRWVSHVPARWWAAFYVTVLALPLGMVLAAGLWPAAAVTAVAVLVPFAAARLRRSRPAPSAVGAVAVSGESP